MSLYMHVCAFVCVCVYVSLCVCMHVRSCARVCTHVCFGLTTQSFVTVAQCLTMICVSNNVSF